MLVLFVGLALLAAAAMGGAFEEGSEDRIVAGYRGFVIEAVRTNMPSGAWSWRVQSGGELVDGGDGWADDADAAIAAAKAWIDVTFPAESEGEPKRPTPEGAPAGVFGACEIRKNDGPFRICLYRTKSGRWAYRVEDGGGGMVGTKAGFGSKDEALLDAWRDLARQPATLSPVPLRRNGLRLMPDGLLELEDFDAFRGWAVPILAQAIGGGEQDPNGLVLDLWLRSFPGVNVFRIRPGGDTFPLVGQRVAPHVGDPAAIPAAIWGPVGVGGNT